MNILRYTFLAVVLPAVALATPRSKKMNEVNKSVTTQDIIPCNLATEGRTTPLGIDVEQPRFSWQLQSQVSDVQQTAYRILVASHPDTLANQRGDLWDSKWVESSSSLWIPYEGTALKPNQRCYWTVQVATNKGYTSWQEPTTFSMGLLGECHWGGRWIGYEHPFEWDKETTHSELSARYFRNTFKLTKPIRRATLHIAGLGLYEAYINGRRVGNDVLAPAPTDYRKAVIYNTYDVTSLLEGSSSTDAPNNCIGVVVGNGRFYTMRQNYKPYKIANFGYPKLRANLIIEFTDGTSQKIATDEKWRLTGMGPIRSNNEYDGETFDAQLDAQMKGWSTIAYNDSAWIKAERARIPDGTLVGNLTPSMRVVDSIAPRSLTPMSSNESKGRVIVDFGQNFAGWVRMNVAGKGAKGDTIRIRLAERLTADGELYVENLRDAYATDYYICNGDEQGTWAPRFTYHGFRYAELTNYPNATASDFVGEVVSDPMQRTGFFECANPTLNQIFQNAYWGILSNYKGMPVDCPQRNERQPWLGDRAMGCWGESYMMNNQALYSKWLDDIEESQRADGVIPDVAPAFWNYYSDNVSWPSVFIFAAEMLYQQYGDDAAIRKHYPAMKKWLRHFEKEKMNKDYIVKADKYGDWCVPPESLELIHALDENLITDGRLIGTAYYYALLGKMMQFSELLEAQAPQSKAADYMDDKAYFADLRAHIREHFNKEFLHVTSGKSPAPGRMLYPDSIFYGNNTVTSNLLPLAFDMVPEEYRQTIEQQVIQKIILKPADGHISCGVIGIQWLMRELSKMGRTDIAYLLATIKSYPSWGYMVDQGATTIWELWNGNTANPKMNSGNHVMLLGDLLPWCFENLAGIKAIEPGFHKFALAPNFELQELSHVTAQYLSPYGPIKSKWVKTNAHLEWDIDIPANTSAIVTLPANVIADAKGKGRGSKKAPAKKASRTLTLTSGHHHLTYKLDPSRHVRASIEQNPNDSIRDDRKGILADEFLYETAPFPSCHSASIAELPNGDLLCTYFGGAREGAPDVCIWTSRKRRLADGSMQPDWEAPQLVVDGVLSDTLRKACYNPVLFQIPDGDLLLFFKIGKNVKDWTGYILRSRDNGHTWVDRETLPDSLLGAIKNKPELIDGKIIAPSSKEAGGWRCYMEMSDDMGKSWRLVGPIGDGKFKGIQPTLLKHKDGRLQMLCRDQKAEHIGTSWSNDNGETWSNVTTIDEPNNNSGLDAVTLPNGTFAMVYNPTFKVPSGQDKPKRTPLCVALSKDGVHWTHYVTLEDSPIGQYSYPSMIVGTDGCLHIVYTWRRQRIKYIKLKVM